MIHEASILQAIEKKEYEKKIPLIYVKIYIYMLYNK